MKDKMYGEFEVEENIKRIVESEPVQRLKMIRQFGVPSKYYHLKEEKCFSRFEHSVGVMLLLRKLGASKEEQAAGLIHDVSHTAFSHVVDWVFDNGQKEDYQDRRHENYVFGSELPDTLKESGYDINRILNEDNFPLLEQKIPELCADRIDYALRETDLGRARRLVDKLEVKKSKIVFEDKKSAAEFGHLFLDRQIGHWGGYEAVVRYKLFAEVLKTALKKSIINRETFQSTDELIIERLKTCGNEKIETILSLLEKNSLKDLPKSNERAYKKFRYVDPIFNDLKLSEVDKDFERRLKEAREWNRKGIVLPTLQFQGGEGNGY